MKACNQSFEWKVCRMKIFTLRATGSTTYVLGMRSEGPRNRG
jgi:hypothetical protein